MDVSHDCCVLEGASPLDPKAASLGPAFHLGTRTSSHFLRQVHNALCYRVRASVASSVGAYASVLCPCARQVVINVTSELTLSMCVGDSLLPTDGDPDRCLPCAHTCSFRLDLPRYTTASVLQRQLLLAAESCVGYVGDFAGMCVASRANVFTPVSLSATTWMAEQMVCRHLTPTQRTRMTPFHYCNDGGASDSSTSKGMIDARCRTTRTKVLYGSFGNAGLAMAAFVVAF